MAVMALLQALDFASMHVGVTWTYQDSQGQVGGNFSKTKRTPDFHQVALFNVESENEVTQLCPTLSDPMDCSLPGSSAHGIFQARVLEWGAIAFSLLVLEVKKSPYDEAGLVFPD